MLLKAQKTNQERRPASIRAASLAAKSPLGKSDSSQSGTARAAATMPRNGRMSVPSVQPDAPEPESDRDPDILSDPDSESEEDEENEAEAEPQKEPESDDEAQLNARKTASLHITQTNWSIKNIRQMFKGDAHKASLKQAQGPNNNFFKYGTLAVMQKLPHITPGRQEDIKARLWKSY